MATPVRQTVGQITDPTNESDRSGTTDRVGRERADRSPIIRALRFAGEEVQLGLALEVICQEGAVASAFCEAVIARSARGNQRARRVVKREAGEVTCMGEQRLNARVSRRMARSRAAGRVDLRFSGEGAWKLGVELKIDSAFGRKQLERYVKWGPVIAVVRNLGQIPDLPNLRQHENWVGAATWSSLLPDLRTLPVDLAWNRDWHALLDIMEEDGDFSETRPKPPEVDAQVQLLQAIAPTLQERFEAAMQRTYGDVADALAITHSGIHRSRTWASFGISATDGPWLWIGIRNLWSRAPRLWIDYYPVPGWQARRRLEKPHRQIERAKFYPKDTYYTFEQPIERLEGATAEHHAEALDVIAGQLEKLVWSRVFDVEVERLTNRRRRRR